MDAETPVATTFGSRLGAKRRERGMTQEELGKGLGPDGGDVTKAAVSAWETDRNQPTAAQLRVICERLAVTADELLGLQLPWNGNERRALPAQT